MHYFIYLLVYLSITALLYLYSLYALPLYLLAKSYKKGEPISYRQGESTTFAKNRNLTDRGAYESNAGDRESTNSTRKYHIVKIYFIIKKGEIVSN